MDDQRAVEGGPVGEAAVDMSGAANEDTKIVVDGAPANALEAVPKGVFSNLTQVCVVVRDLDKTMKVLTEVFGIGPFRTIRYPPEDWGREDWHCVYHGEPGDFTAWLAFAKVDPSNWN